MTDLVPATGPAAAPWAGIENVGMEDVDAGDLRMPRLKILHKKNQFAHSVSGLELGDKVYAIVLGFMKQRTFFPPGDAGEQNRPPICKSNDFELGFPTDPFGQSEGEKFPWQAAGLERANFPLDDATGRVKIPCEMCQLKEWREKTFNDKGKPYCGEQHTWAMLLWDGTDYTMPILFNVKSAGLSASTRFISTFATRSRPFFTATTVIELVPSGTEQVPYSLPKFVPDLELDHMTAQDRWTDFIEQMKGIRETSRMPPRPFEKDEAGNLISPEAKAANASPEAQYKAEEAAAGPAPAWAQYQTDPDIVPGAVVPDAPTPAPEPAAPPTPAQAPPSAPAPPAAAPPAPAPVQAPTPPVAPPAPPVAAPTPPVQQPQAPEPQYQAPPTPPTAPPAAPPASALPTPPAGATSGGLPF